MKTFFKSILLVTFLYTGSYAANFYFNDRFHKVNKVVEKARSYLGVEYVYGEEDYNGIDCSGLTMRAYEGVGVSIPRSSRAQNEAGEEVLYKDIEPGDLLFFEGESFHHVALVTEVDLNKEVTFIHAPHAGSVVKEEKLDDYYKQSLYKIVRVIE